MPESGLFYLCPVNTTPLGLGLYLLSPSYQIKSSNVNQKARITVYNTTSNLSTFCEFLNNSSLHLKQARRQSSVTGGRGGQKKYFRGHRSIFPSSFGGKTKNKGIYPGRLRLYGAQVFVGGGGARLYCLMERGGIQWCGSRSLPTNSRVETKKKSLAQNIMLTLDVHSFFVLERNFTHAWGDTSGILGGHSPQNARQWHQACYFISKHNSRLEGTLLAWGGTSSDLGGTAPKCPTWRRA